MANHHIRAGATGTADGSDWTNAWTELPANLTRGDTYYLADGTYPRHTFYDGESGTLYIYIKKATVSAHGTDTGWLNAYGDGVALFTNATGVTWKIQSGYYDFDGVVGSLNSGHGFKLYNIQNSDSNGCVYIENGYTVSHISVKHTEFEGPGWGNHGQTCLFSSNSVTERSTWTLQYCYFHGCGQAWVAFQSSTHPNMLIERCWFEDCGSNDAALHSAGIILGSTSTTNFTFRYNMLKNMRGDVGLTCWIEQQLAGGSGFYIYGNTIWSNVADGYCGTGLMTFLDYSNCTDMFFYNNTMYGLKGASGIYCRVTETNFIARNNIWQACELDPVFTNVNTVDHNELNTGTTSFVNAAGGDFHLSSETDAGIALASPYDTDPDEITRGAGSVWDLGAYEFAEDLTDTIFYSQGIRMRY
jgi:hypothetical protein